MEALVKWLLTAQGVSVTGVLLAFTVLLLYGLHKQWWVPGWIYREIEKDRDDLRAAERIRLEEDKVKSAQLADSAEQMRLEIEELKIALVKRDERRSRQRSQS